MTLGEQHFGRDVSIPEDPEADLIVTPTGDLPTMAGVPNVRAALRRRILTEPGDLLHRSTYGAGLEEYLSKPNSPGAHSQIANSVRRNCFNDPRIANCIVSVGPDLARPQAVTIELAIELRDGSKDTSSLTVET